MGVAVVEVCRVGRSSTLFTNGKRYLARYIPIEDAWGIKNDVGSLSTIAIYMDGYWKVPAGTDLKELEAGSKNVEEKFVLQLKEKQRKKNMGINIEKGVTLIDGKNQEGYTAEHLIEMIRNCKARVASLEDLGRDSKYLAAQRVKAQANIDELVRLLDLRA